MMSLTLAEKRVNDFERKYGEVALQLAYHAALPVALNADLLHLLRINFFLDPPATLPYTAEFELLLSPLCREIDEGLYEIEPEIRDILLQGLCSIDRGQRIKDVATLLWQYIDREAVWIDRVELERAQQLTVLNFLDPAQAKYYLAEGDAVIDDGKIGARDWYVAMRQEIDRYPEPDMETEIGSISADLELDINKRKLIWEQKNTKIYTLCTDSPWTLSFDALVIPVGVHGSIGRFGQSFEYSQIQFYTAHKYIVHKNWLSSEIHGAMRDQNQDYIVAERPLLFSLPINISGPNFESKKRFIICATAEDYRGIPHVDNLEIAIREIVNLTKQRNIRSLVLPLIGTGASRLDVDQSAKQILSSLLESRANINSHLEVTIVDKEHSSLAKVGIPHFSILRTKITDLEILKDTLQELGISFKMDAEVRGSFGLKSKVDIVAVLEGKCDLGWARNSDGSFDLVADLWGISKIYNQTELVITVQQKYAELKKIKDTSEYTIEEVQVQNQKSSGID